MSATAAALEEVETRVLRRATCHWSVAERPPARFPWPFTRAELAGMIGCPRQSVDRLLADFVADGLLRFPGDDLVTSDVVRLGTAARR